MFLAVLRAVGLALILIAGPALAMGPDVGDVPVKGEDPDYERAVALIWSEAFVEAEPLLQASLKRNPKNPDAWNYLGFVTRKLGNPADAEVFYANALRLDPGHLQAMEYLGELYLETGRPDRAIALLDQLVTLCPRDCEARDKLAAAIDAQRLKQ
jgi:cytochrome c-type biogenesis protein CcmH/NrfG